MGENPLKFLKLREGLMILFISITFLVSFGFLIINSVKYPRLFSIIWFNFILILSLLPTLLMMMIINFILKKISLSCIKRFQSIKNPEIAIILGDDSINSNFGNLFISTYLGIRFLIKYLQLKEKNFKIFIEPSRLEFKKIVQDEKIKQIYLIGHGSKRSFALNRKEDNLLYSEFSSSKYKKEEIHLYHCTHSKENPSSLIDYLVKKENKEKCFISNKKISVIDYVLLLYKLYKEEKRRRKK